MYNKNREYGEQRKLNLDEMFNRVLFNKLLPNYFLNKI